MVKNYLLWLIFSVLLTVASAAACLAGQDSDISQNKNPKCCFTTEENIKKDGKENFNQPVPKETKEEKIQEASPSILNSNFIFYIIYKFKFVDSKGSQYKNENEDKAVIPLFSYTRTIYKAINALFEKKF